LEKHIQPQMVEQNDQNGGFIVVYRNKEKNTLDKHNVFRIALIFFARMVGNKQNRETNN